MSPHRPLRTCIGCRAVVDRSALVRVVRRSMDDQLVVDARGAAPGRGAWVHPARGCLRAGLENGGFARALRGAVAKLDEAGREQLWATLDAARETSRRT